MAKKPLPPAREYPIELLPLSQVEPNAWNPNRQSDRQFQANQESLLSYGFVTPIVVRPHPEEESRFQIIDGEHRWRAMRAFADEGLPPGASDQMKQMIAQGVIPAQVVPMPDAWAKKFTVIANETRGKADAVELGALLHELSKDTALEDLQRGLPFSPQELEELIKIGEFDWDAYNQADGKDASPEAQEPDAFERFKVAMPESAYEVYKQAFDRLAALGELHPDAAIAHGQVIEALAAEYLATHGGLGGE